MVAQTRLRILAFILLLTVTTSHRLAMGQVRSHLQTGQPASGQTLSMALNPRSTPPPQLKDYDKAAKLAMKAGVTATLVTDTWSSLEPVPNQIDVSGLKQVIDYYTSKGLQLYIGLQVINTIKREVPPDLENVPFDSAVMASRFHKLLDQVLPLLGSNAKYISIGNEVDGYLAPTNQWAAYQVFYEDSLGYIHQNRPGTLVGVTTTFGGGQTHLAQIQALNTKSDIYILTYYPLHGDFQVNSPTSPATDFPQMLTWTTKPVFLQEVGFPSDPATGSSRAKESQFVTSAFAAWHAAGPQIPFFSYFLEHDFDPTTCKTLAQYYGLQNDHAFIGYLCSLGVRTDTGTAKPAWKAFVAGASAN
jgi:hypothetical protein